MNNPFRNFLIVILFVKVSAYPINDKYLLQESFADLEKEKSLSSLSKIASYPSDDLYAAISQDSNFYRHNHNYQSQEHNKEEIESFPRALLYRMPEILPSTSSNLENNFETIIKENKQDEPGGNDITSKSELERNQLQIDGFIEDSDAEKRNALHTSKREKFMAPQQFIPSISVGAMTNLGDFFDTLKSNVEVLEKGNLTNDEEHLLSGDHPVSSLRLDNMESRPSGTAAFLHAIRTYRPSQRVRALVSMNPEGYHGSNFLDPNYMWLGLGK